jgi:hypothetical protein
MNFKSKACNFLVKFRAGSRQPRHLARGDLSPTFDWFAILKGLAAPRLELDNCDPRGGNRAMRQGWRSFFAILVLEALEL